MQNLKTLFNNASRNTAMDASSWTYVDPNPGGTWEDGVWKPSSEKTPWEKGQEAVKKALQDASKGGKAYETYLQTLNMLKTSRVNLPGKIALGMESPRTYGGQAPGKSRVGVTSFEEKLNEVNARMRKFAVQKYYAGITYGK